MLKIAVEIDIEELIKKALQVEDKRGRDIIVRRFGLKTPDIHTLASLGEEYGLTRERVRQIEASTLNGIRERIKEEKQTLLFLELMEKYLGTTSFVNPSAFRVFPVITCAASFAKGTPIALLTNGTVRDARGLTSRQ